MKRRARLVASVAWPAFLTAALLEIAVFAFVDPAALHMLDGSRLALSDTAIYSLAFLVFWAIAMGAGYLTLMLNQSADEVNALSRGDWR